MSPKCNADQRICPPPSELSGLIEETFKADDFTDSELSVFDGLPNGISDKLIHFIKTHKERMSTVKSATASTPARIQAKQKEFMKLTNNETSLLDDRRRERDKLQLLEKEESRAVTQDNDFFKEIAKEDTQNVSKIDMLQKEHKRITEETKRIISVRLGSRTTQGYV